MAIFKRTVHGDAPTLANPYRGTGHAIVYNVIKVSDGWDVSVRLPKNTSASDRVKVINWFHAYRAEVRKKNPLWLASFRVLQNGYILEIRPTHDVRQLAEAGERVREIWDGTLKYAQG